jgi:hypothetical protein
LLAAGFLVELEASRLFGAEERTAAEEGEAQNEDPQPPGDESLALSAYIEAGMPAHDRRWWGSDMARGADVLAKLAQKNAGHLPRYQSKRSGAAFARLTADENLIAYRDRSTPLEQRFPAALQHMQSSGKLLLVYLPAFQQHNVGGDELVELMGGMLRSSVVIIQLVNEVLPTLDKDDPTYPVRMEGLKAMRSGMASVVAGNLQTLTESRDYRTSELKRLIGYMCDTFPALLPEIPAGSRAETLVRLRSFAEDPKMRRLQPELGKLLEVAEQAVAKRE